MAAAKASTHAVWLKKLLEEMKFKQIEPTKIFHDNKSTISLSKILFCVEGVSTLTLGIVNG